MRGVLVGVIHYLYFLTFVRLVFAVVIFEVVVRNIIFGVRIFAFVGFIFGGNSLRVADSEQLVRVLFFLYAVGRFFKIGARIFYKPVLFLFGKNIRVNIFGKLV